MLTYIGLDNVHGINLGWTDGTPYDYQVGTHTMQCRPFPLCFFSTPSRINAGQVAALDRSVHCLRHVGIEALRWRCAHTCPTALLNANYRQCLCVGRQGELFTLTSSPVVVCLTVNTVGPSGPVRWEWANWSGRSCALAKVR